MMIDYKEVEKFLKELGLTDLNNEDKVLLIEKVKHCSSLKQAKDELELLYYLNKLMISSYKEVSLKNMYKINDDIDGELILKIYLEYIKIRDNANNPYVMEKFKDVFYQILSNDKKVSEKIIKNVGNAMDISYQVHNALYMTMLNTEKADKVYNNLIRRTKDFLARCDSQNIKLLVEFLKKEVKLSNDELIQLSNKCATFFIQSSVKKIQNLALTLNSFKDFIANRLAFNKDKNSQMANSLLERDLKDVIMNSAMIAAKSNESIEETIKFLKGEPIGKILKVNDDWKDFKGDFTPVQLAKIYNQSITSLGIGVDKILDFSRNLSLAYSKVFKSELNRNGLINGHNFNGLISLDKKDYVIQNSNKLEKILTLLSKIMSKEDVENVLKNNVRFLSCSLEEVKLGIKEAILSSNNKDALKKQILGKIRNSFDKFKDENREFNRKKSVNSGPLNKVAIKEMSQEEIASLLAELETDENQVNKWLKSWESEEAEYRQLQMQEDLENLLSECEGAKELIVEESNNLNYLEAKKELEVIKELIEECLDKYEKIAHSKDVNGELSSLILSVNSQLNELVKSLNERLDFYLKDYTDQVKKVNEELVKGLEKSKKLENISTLIEELERKIEEEHIDADKLDKQKQIIEEAREKSLEVKQIVNWLKDTENSFSHVVRKLNSFIDEGVLGESNTKMILKCLEIIEKRKPEKLEFIPIKGSPKENLVGGLIAKKIIPGVNSLLKDESEDLQELVKCVEYISALLGKDFAAKDNEHYAKNIYKVIKQEIDNEIKEYERRKDLINDKQRLEQERDGYDLKQMKLEEEKLYEILASLYATIEQIKEMKIKR